MSNVIRTMGGLVLGAACGLYACGGTTSQSSVATGTAARTPMGVANAQKADKNIVEQLANARCDRETSCDNVGVPKAKYSSRDACMAAMRGDMAPSLNGYDCPGGIDQTGLERCLNAIHDEGCGRPLDTLSRFDRCRSSSLCLK
jgi:hypothetical protein